MRFTYTPSLVSDIRIRVTGRNFNEIKEYIGDEFYTVLTQEMVALPDGSFYSE